MECVIPHKHTLKILCKSKHFPPRYKRKCEWVFLFEVQTKETPTPFFFYISVENVSNGFIQNFQCMFASNWAFQLTFKSKLNIHFYC